ncbi:Transcription elongation factor GreA [Rickettsiales endosymbiont of Paramecium tredecaurelia]|uniref:transcription elongation factor GreA n=1 Tax=Candidatus Sarmatiella mevalonica TaxID=2770581 RepID=UPI0019221533|nr:transcription elongation factor GreA [Candidatus Sarmatiella mevalonica]MBL3285286.1 Transcription elongation factor GreA [Candidatus Sarmatiella mevalonica]
MERFPITARGLEQLEQELKHLKHIERPAVIEAIATAREFGDLSENAEYHSAKEKQGFIEARIKDLEDKLARAEVIYAPQNRDKVQFGATIKLFDEDTEVYSTYQLLGEYESNLSKGRISIKSPIARAAISKSVDDVIEVDTPRGIKIYKIIEIHYEDLENITL